MQTQSAIHAANTLLQAVESSLPKQKKVMAVTEFKHAMVAHKRYSKTHHNKEDLVELPQDVYVFSFMDLQSILSSSQVCRFHGTLLQVIGIYGRHSIPKLHRFSPRSIIMFMMI